MEINVEYCAECLRLIQKGMVTYRRGPASPSQTMYGHMILELLYKYPIKTLETFGEKIPLFAYTMVNNELRCYSHLEK